MLIKNARIFDGDAFVRADRIQFADGRVAALGGACLADAEVFDAGGRMVVPGYVDLHIHGLLGMDLLDEDSACVGRIADALIVGGTTSFLPTVPCSSSARMRASLANIRAAMCLEHGATVLGAHLEGPFLNPAAGGANPAEEMLSPSVDHYTAIVGGLEDAVLRVTLAPELEGGMALVSYLCARGVRVSAGHTTLDGDAFTEAVDRGLSGCTHFFNGMARFSHREMNIISRALTDDRIWIECIPDLRHISRDAVEILCRCKGGHVYICTDSTVPAGLPDGDYSFLAGEYHLCGGVSIRPDNGSLSGSTITLQEGVRRLASGTDLPLETVLHMATGAPAGAQGLEREVGFLRVGRRADALVLDEDLSVLAVLQGGRVAYKDE